MEKHNREKEQKNMVDAPNLAAWRLPYSLYKVVSSLYCSDYFDVLFSPPCTLKHPSWNTNWWRKAEDNFAWAVNY